MKRFISRRHLIAAAAGLCSLSPALIAQPQPVHVVSPNGTIQFVFTTQPNRTTPSELSFRVLFQGKPLLDDSGMGLELAGQPPLGPGMQVEHVTTTVVDETYKVVAGKANPVRNRYNAATVELADPDGRKLNLEARAYDDGVAFRYVIPDQQFHSVRITGERTQFAFSKDAFSYPLVLPDFQSSYEGDYQERSISGLDNHWFIALPLLAQEPGVGWLAITEADIENYAGMYLRHSGNFGSHTLVSQLAPRVDDPGVAVIADTPVKTPWRVIMIGSTPGELIESNLVLNLNPPSAIEDTSWIRPGKSAWDWWSGQIAEGVPFVAGMNTATMEHYIDFAARSGFAYMLIDAGWALAPEPGDNDSSADITRTNPDIDMPELLHYAKQHNVKLWLWSHWKSVDRQMDQAFPLYEKWGIAGVKIDFMSRDDQQMVAFYRRVLKTAAKYHLMIDFHGAYKPDGIRRTYPNLLTREAVMGLEYSKWSSRITPIHDCTLPFTRMLAGPMDYTPGGFLNVTAAEFVARERKPMVMGTRAHQLALFVVFESPFQVVADYPEQYVGQKEFAFIRQVPTAWDETHVLAGQPMEYISIARRHGTDWYVGSLTNWDERTLQLPLKFLGGGNYVAEIYGDAADASSQPTHTIVRTEAVNRSTVLRLHLASGGGSAIWIHPATAR